MLHGRRIALLLLAAALLVAGAATTADARKKRHRPAKPLPVLPQPKGQRFTVTFWEKRTTTWEQPAFNHLTDCFHRYFSEGKGSESVELSLRRPARVLVLKGADVFQPVNFVWGTWDLTQPGRPARVSGTVIRTRKTRSWSEAGTCGGTTKEDPRPDQDCGTRLPNLEMIMQVAPDRRLYARIGGDQTVSQADREGATFKRCDVLRPKDARDEWDPEAPKVSPGAFLDRRRSRIAFAYDEAFTETAPADARPFKTTTRVQWKIVFTRAVP